MENKEIENKIENNDTESKDTEDKTENKIKNKDAENKEIENKNAKHIFCILFSQKLSFVSELLSKECSFEFSVKISIL
ncbi:MAG: hypothetical protein FWD37_02530 [Methanomassiliicoccaceae archaeon]|nr:hypothetical protein [Methanomassiliicoccaceae archaeon]